MSGKKPNIQFIEDEDRKKRWENAEKHDKKNKTGEEMKTYSQEDGGKSGGNLQNGGKSGGQCQDEGKSGGYCQDVQVTVSISPNCITLGEGLVVSS